MDTPDDNKVRPKLTARSNASNAGNIRRNELHEASDRVCAIVWGATIHDLLKAAIRDRLIKNDAHASRLFGGDGPLANFSVLHNLAHAIGLVGDNVRDDINQVREIRNAFAHSVSLLNSKGNPKRITFRSDKIAAHCQNLKCPELVPRPTASWSARLTCERLGLPAPTKTSIPDTPRRRFQWTCECLAYILSTMALGVHPKWKKHVEYAPAPRLAVVVSDWEISGTAVDYPLA